MNVGDYVRIIDPNLEQEKGIFQIHAFSYTEEYLNTFPYTRQLYILKDLNGNIVKYKNNIAMLTGESNLEYPFKYDIGEKVCVRYSHIKFNIVRRYVHNNFSQSIMYEAESSESGELYNFEESVICSEKEFEQREIINSNKKIEKTKKTKRTWTYKKKDVQIKFTYCETMDRWVAKHKSFVIQFYNVLGQWFCCCDCNSNYGRTISNPTKTIAIKGVLNFIDEIYKL